MSFWYQPKRKDMEIDGDEINIYLGSDNSGNIYAGVKIEDIRDLLQELTKK